MGGHHAAREQTCETLFMTRSLLTRYMYSPVGDPADWAKGF